MSGYHMVKLLAASDKWAKVYCPSRRPVPDGLFADLDANADKIEHVSIDFLDGPKIIAKFMGSRINHVYAQPFASLS